MSLRLLALASLCLVACARPGSYQAVPGSSPSSTQNREAVAYTPAPRGGRAAAESPEAKPAAAEPSASSQEILRATPPPPPESPAPARPAAPAPEAKRDDPTESVYFSLSSVPRQDATKETEWAPLDVEEEAPAQTPAPAPKPSAAAPAPPRASEPNIFEKGKPAPPTVVTRRSSAKPASPSSLASDTSYKEKRLLQLINAARAQSGAPPLRLSRHQSNGANGCMGSVGHSEYMARRGNISHDNFPRDICVQATEMGENVAYASGDENRALEIVHRSLMNSAGHRRNILDPAFNTVGLGFFYYKGRLYVTESFLHTK